MNYTEARNYANENNTISPGLDNITALCDALDNPQNKLRIIHIAGTNGKGSVGAFIEAILKKEGLRVGRFSSPAVFDYREQFTVNGRNIEKPRYAELMGKIKTAAEESAINPTPFEKETALAFLYFFEEKCDFAIIECGMGGRLDATNIVKSSVAVITPIDIDHTKFLGNSIEEIAAEKAGIIKENSIAVSANQEESVIKILRDTAKEKNAEFILCNGTEYDISLKGAYQPYNAALARAAASAIGVSEDSIKDGLNHTVWHGRFEIIHENPTVIIDGAHNVNGARALTKSLDLYYKDRKIIYIMGVFADKDYEKIAEITADRADMIYTITPPNPRGLDNGILAETVKKYNENVRAVSLDTAVKRCMEEKDAVTVAFGSLSFLSVIKNKVGNYLETEKCSEILNNAKFMNILERLKNAESDRIYCRHGIEHLLDVARAGYALILENGLDIPKGIIYAAALLHDLGRLAEYENNIPHEEESARLAREILPECGYNREETEYIADAILNHRTETDKIETLSDVLYEADKRTRMCMMCEAQSTCKWDKYDRNLNIVI